MEGTAVKRWRENHGLTQEELADLLGVRAISISRWERGAQRPPGKLLELALDLLDQRLAKKEKDR